MNPPVIKCVLPRYSDGELAALFCRWLGSRGLVQTESRLREELEDHGITMCGDIVYHGEEANFAEHLSCAAAWITLQGALEQQPRQQQHHAHGAGEASPPQQAGESRSQSRSARSRGSASTASGDEGASEEEQEEGQENHQEDYEEDAIMDAAAEPGGRAQRAHSSGASGGSSMQRGGDDGTLSCEREAPGQPRRAALLKHDSAGPSDVHALLAEGEEEEEDLEEEREDEAAARCAPNGANARPAGAASPSGGESEGRAGGGGRDGGATLPRYHGGRRRRSNSSDEFLSQYDRRPLSSRRPDGPYGGGRPADHEPRRDRRSEERADHRPSRASARADSPGRGSGRGGGRSGSRRGDAEDGRRSGGDRARDAGRAQTTSLHGGQEEGGRREQAHEESPATGGRQLWPRRDEREADTRQPRSHSPVRRDRGADAGTCGGSSHHDHHHHGSGGRQAPLETRTQPRDGGGGSRPAAQQMGNGARRHRPPPADHGAPPPPAGGAAADGGRAPLKLARRDDRFPIQNWGDKAKEEQQQLPHSGGGGGGEPRSNGGGGGGGGDVEPWRSGTGGGGSGSREAPKQQGIRERAERDRQHEAGPSEPRGSVPGHAPRRPPPQQQQQKHLQATDGSNGRQYAAPAATARAPYFEPTSRKRAAEDGHDGEPAPSYRSGGGGGTNGPASKRTGRMGGQGDGGGGNAAGAGRRARASGRHDPGLPEEGELQ